MPISVARLHLERWTTGWLQTIELLHRAMFHNTGHLITLSVRFPKQIKVLKWSLPLSSWDRKYILCCKFWAIASWILVGRTFSFPIHTLWSIHLRSKFRSYYVRLMKIYRSNLKCCCPLVFSMLILYKNNLEWMKRKLLDNLTDYDNSSSYYIKSIVSTIYFAFFCMYMEGSREFSLAFLFSPLKLEAPSKY